MAMNLRRRTKDGETKGGKVPSEEGREKDRNGRRTALILCLIALPVLILFYAVVLYWSNPHTGGRQLRLDAYLTLIRQGQVQDATILDVDNRITGHYSGGQYWIATGSSQISPIFSQIFAALNQAGVPNDWWCVDLCFWPNAWDVTAQSKTFLEAMRRKYGA
jgi:hypothetical protein